MARRLASALRAGGVPIATTSYHRDHRDLGSAWSHHGSSDFPFDVNLLVVHPDHMTDFVLDSGPALFHGRYTIGLWVWDLRCRRPQWPTRRDGARGVDAYVVRARKCLHGVRRACPRGPHPGRTGADSRRDRACDRPAGWPRVRVAASTSTAGSPVRTRSEPCRRTPGVLAEGWPSPRHRCQPRRPVPAGARSARRPGRRASRCGDTTSAGGRPPSGTASWRRPTATSRSTGRTGARGGGQSHVMGDVHGGHRERRSPWSSRARGQWPGPLRSRGGSRRRVPLPDRARRGPSRILEHASSLLRSVVDEPEATAAKVRRARQVAARRFSRSAAAAQSTPGWRTSTLASSAGHRRIGSAPTECVVTPVRRR